VPFNEEYAQELTMKPKSRLNVHKRVI